MRGILKIFLSSPGSNKWAVVFCVLVSSAAEGVGLAVLLPLLSAATDGGQEQPSKLAEIVMTTLRTLGLPTSLEMLLAIVAVGMVLKVGLLIVAMRYVGYVIADVATAMRSKLISSVLEVRWPYFTQMQKGAIANAVGIDATRSGAAYRLATVSLASLVQTAVYVVLALLVSVKLAFASLVLGAAIAFILRPLVRMAKKAGRKQRIKTEELVTLVTDALGNIKPLKAMGRQNHLARFVDKKIGSLRKGLRREAVSRLLMKSLQEPLLVIFLAAGFYVARIRMHIPISTLMVMALLLERTVRAINQMQMHVQKAAILEASYWSVKRMTQEARGFKEEWQGTRQPTLEISCRLDDVCFSYGDKKVLDHVSFEAPAGRLTVITGASGAGKTTITDLLLGMIEPDSGSVIIDNVPLEEIDLRKWRGMVGYVPQELTLFHDSILANVNLGDPAISEAKVEQALKDAGAWDFVHALSEGVHTTVGEGGSQLSGGQRQRIALARALVLNPSLLILDEVTSALDPETEKEICRNVLDLARNRTVIAITHKALWAEAADRTWHLGPEGARLLNGA